MRIISIFCVVNLIWLFALSINAAELVLTSPEVKDGKRLSNKQVANIFGCAGDNLSPQLAWINIPKGTKS
ncbi:MAG: hypothetical protein JW841_03445 [Deltaproteobacteria bacterium]|nr:hypothetical protein [Deltaproteobacteria bacterium]